MLWFVTAVTFLASAAIVVLVAYAASTPTAAVIADRLTQLSRPAASEAPVPFRERQTQRVQRMLADVGKIVPASQKTLSRSQRLLIRAGYRRAEAGLAFRGVKLILPIALVGAAFSTTAYNQNPPLVFAVSVMAGFLLPDMWLTWRVRKRQHRVQLGLPDGLDLLVVCVEAGLGLDQAILRVGQELNVAHPELSEELRLVNAEMRVGKSRLEALRELANRTGVDDIKALVAMLVQTDRFGTSIAQSLRVQSDNLRVKRRQRAEEAAAKTPVKMVPVLVFFIFPALFVVILGPAVISVVRQLLPLLLK